MKKYISIVLFLYVCISCGKSHYYAFASLPDDYKIKKPIKLENYDVYTFKMVKDVKGTLPIEERPFTNSVQHKEPHLVYEELYLLLNKYNKEVLYMTTFSHKYIYEGGAFNCKENDSIIYFNQVEYIYQGVQDSLTNEFRFRNPGDTFLRALYMGYKKNKDTITLTTVPNVNPIRKIRKKKPIINLNDMFGVQLQFERDHRKWCFKDKKKRIFDVDTIYHNNSHYLFYIKRNDKPYLGLIKGKENIKYFLDTDFSDE